MARVVLPIAGAIVGSFFGMPQLGWAIGAAIGNAVDPQIIKGPGIGEIAQQTSQEGGPRPIVFALSQPIAGNIIATSEPRIVKRRSGGKGGPKVETESVYRTYAIGVCEGIITAFVRVWRNGILVYDAREGNTPENAKFLERARFFLGTFDQNASPDLEAIFGVGTTPAHRGTAYMVMASDDLTDLRGSIPQYTFQVTKEADIDCADTTEYDNDYLHEWTAGEDPRHSCATYEYNITGYGGTPAPPTGSAGPYETLEEALEKIATETTRPAGEYVGYEQTTDGILNTMGGPTVLPLQVEIYMHFNHVAWDENAPDLAFQCCGFIQPYLIAEKTVHSNSCFSTGGGSRGAVYGAAPTSGSPVTPDFSSGWDAAISCGGDGPDMYMALDHTVKVTLVPGPPPHPCDPCGNLTTYPSEVPGYCVDEDGNFYSSAPWVKTNGTFRVLQQAVLGGVTYVKKPLGPARPASHAEYDDQAFWEAAYEEAVVRGDMAAGLVYGVHYPAPQSYAWVRASSSCPVTPTSTPLQEVVAEICSLTGLTPALIDVSQIEGDVRGFTVTNQYPAYAALKALSDVFLFDPSPRDGVLHFIPRGLNTVRTILDEEMVDDRDDAEEVDKRADGLSIPRVMHLNYYDIAGGISTDKQSSERAGDRRAVGEASLSTSIIMDANEAARVVVINHKVGIEDAKGEIRFSVPDMGDFIELTTADAIFVQRGAKLFRCRITKYDIQDGYQELTVLRDRQSAYTSDVEGIPASTPTPPPSSLIGPTLLELLDIHILQDADDSVGLGFYVAISGIFPAWQGALVELSHDGGETYTDSATIKAQAILGITMTVLDDHPQAYPDDVHTVQVKLRMPDDELEDTDFVGLLNRENLALIGDEIFQFQTADEVEPGIWELSYLVRGRKGTQTQAWPVGTRFVLLDRATLTFAPAELTDLGKVLTFRATSIGAPSDTGITKTLTFSGGSQRERQPAYLQAFRSGDDLIIRWQGVGRLGAGAQAAHGAYFTGYRVTIDDGTNETVIDTTDQTVTRAAGLFDDDITISVQQVNSLTGPGPSISIQFHVRDAISYPTNMARVTFGGTPDGTEDVVVSGLYTPKVGAPIPLSLAIDGTGKDDPEDYADELFAYLDGLALPINSFVSQVGAAVEIEAREGDNVNLSASAVHPFMQFRFEPYDPMDPFSQKWEGGTYRTPQPASDGTKQEIYIDLYQRVGGFVNPAPENDPTYRIGGAAVVSFTVYGIDYDTTMSMPVPYLGQVVQLNWNVPNNISDSKHIALTGLVQNSGLPDHYPLLAQYAELIQHSTVAGRTVIMIRMKYNYVAAVDVFSPGWNSNGSHPSGYLPATQEYNSPEPRYPLGAKMMVGFGFGGEFAAGMELQITLNGVTYSHEVVDAAEADALNLLDNSPGSPFIAAYNAVIDDFKTQVEVGGNFVLLHETFSNGQYKDPRIERTVANTAFTFSGLVTGYDLTILNEFEST